MTTQLDLKALAGKTVVGSGGEKIGKVVDVYESNDGAAEGTFVTVATGLFGSHASFVPLAQAQANGDTITVPYDKELVKDAPRVERDDELSAQEEERLYAHYSLAGSTGRTGTIDMSTDTTRTNTHGTVGHDTSGPTTDNAMTRSEERLQVGTQQTEVGRARLRKYVVTENVSQTVPVSHEEVRIQREPITDANRDAALAGPAISEEEHEVVLHAEKPVVAKETVPVERVRLDTETVRDEVTVTEQVRKEQIDTSGVETDGVRTDETRRQR
jgi:uncharacterized protein (TIGR02271 family)